MKLLIASDIHGSSFWCRQLMNRWDEERPDRVVLLGDLLYHGARNDLPEEYAPKAVLAMLNERKNDLLCVRGNCDSEVDQMVLDFPIMAEYSLLLLGNRTVYATHGHHCGEHNPPPHRAGDYLLCGHTHIPAWTQYSDYTYLNCGSVSIPKAGSRHSYLTWQDGLWQWKDVATGEVYHTMHD